MQCRGSPASPAVRFDHRRTRRRRRSAKTRTGGVRRHSRNDGGLPRRRLGPSAPLLRDCCPLVPVTEVCAVPSHPQFRPFALSNALRCFPLPVRAGLISQICFHAPPSALPLRFCLLPCLLFFTPKSQRLAARLPADFLSTLLELNWRGQFYRAFQLPASCLVLPE